MAGVISSGTVIQVAGAMHTNKQRMVMAKRIAPFSESPWVVVKAI